MCFRPLAGIMLYSPPPSKRGRWRAVRAGGGACSGCDFLTLEMRGSFIAPLPPLRGPPPPLWQGRLGFARSVPLRGCGFKIVKNSDVIPADELFPSPCGDVVLKFVFTAHGAFAGLFPSPCGDVVLKYHCCWVVSIRNFKVSVPLRGCGFKILTSCGTGSSAMFPSPCGDVVLKSLRLEALLCLVQNGTLRRGCVSPPFCVGDVF